MIAVAMVNVNTPEDLEWARRMAAGDVA